MAQFESDEVGTKSKPIDRRSYMLGMITSFGECVAAEAKKCAFSPPFYSADYSELKDEAEKILTEMGLMFWLEENEDIEEGSRLLWWVIYKFPEVLEEYRVIRNAGYNPAYEFASFSSLLSYGFTFGENAEKVTPKMRKNVDSMATVKRILFRDREWPLNETSRLYI